MEPGRHSNTSWRVAAVMRAVRSTEATPAYRVTRAMGARAMVASWACAWAWTGVPASRKQAAARAERAGRAGRAER